jgi:hypothetical protein
MTTHPRAHSLFSVWSPDQVAECLEGVDEALYGRLWDLVAYYPKKKRSEWNDDFADRCLKRFWKHLDAADKATLNRLAAEEEARDDARRAEASAALDARLARYNLED